MRQPFLIISIIAAVWLSGCSGNILNPDDAKEQITKYYAANPQELAGNVSFEAVIRGTDSGSNSKLFNLYINEGLLQLKETRTVALSDSVHIYEVTEKGRPYILKETTSAKGFPFFVVKIFDYYITDIEEVKYSPNKKEAAAFFDLRVKDLTPFGEKAADPDHKIPIIAFFQFAGEAWKFQRIEVNIEKL